MIELSFYEYKKGKIQKNRSREASVFNILISGRCTFLYLCRRCERVLYR